MNRNPLVTDIKYLKGVGEARAKILASELDIHSVRDLLYTAPSKYIDRSRFYTISEMTENLPVIQVKGRFVRFSTEGEGVRQRYIGLFHDGHSMMHVTWFKGIRFIKEKINTGTEYVLLGKPSYFQRSYSFIHPTVEIYNPAKPPTGLQGIYSLPETLRRRNITGSTISALVAQVLDKFTDIPDTLPSEITGMYHLMPLRQTLQSLHMPSDTKTLALARERLKFEELFYLQLHILRYACRRNSTTRGQIFGQIGRFFNDFYHNALPFPLTGAQKRVIKEIRHDMRTGLQMNRLLQGDVGSGKTMVAFMTMLIAIDNGCQACLMAPTEILAAQHFDTISVWAEKIGLHVQLLTGSTRAKARREIDEGLLSGKINILIGTHAVIEERVQFENLGMVVIDEQHRFGVAQRARLWQKNSVAPHVLVMTATPIPRTLAMTVYGDLRVSVIDELPPGRKPVTTLLRYEENRHQVYRAVHSELLKGHQAYVVYPLINESEKTELKSLEEGYQQICEAFPSFKVCYVHGRMKPAEKEHQMQLFVSGKANILVATTVIEVGVNVPNASVMIIENAERFGLSQLHQLRGRVGRGAEQSYCILMSKQKIAALTRKRLNVMTETTDGFIVSEADMRMRGPGDMEGTQQSGIAFNLQHANLANDGQILERARKAATDVLAGNPQISGTDTTTAFTDDRDTKPLPLSAGSLHILAGELRLRFSGQYDWGRIS